MSVKSWNRIFNTNILIPWVHGRLECDVCVCVRVCVCVDGLDESCHAYEWVVSHIRIVRFTICLLFICVPWLIICVTWLINVNDMTHEYVWHDSWICVKWLIHMCDMTHSYVCHDSFICVTWLIHMCDMTHSHVWHVSFTYVTWLIHVVKIRLRAALFTPFIWKGRVNYHPSFERNESRHQLQ